MPDIPSFKAPSVPTLPSLSLLGANTKAAIPNIPNISSLSSLGSSAGASVPTVGGLVGKIPSADSLKSTIPNIPSPSLPTDLSLGGKTDLATNLPKFDSKIDLPEIETGKLGLLSSPVDLGTFKDKTMSSIDSLVPTFSPSQKIGALQEAADKKSALMESLKTAAGGALGAAAGAALSGGNLKNIAGSALGAAAGGVAGGLASKAGLGSTVAGALGSAAGALASGKNIKQAVGGAVGNVVGGAVGNLASKAGINANIGGALGSIAGVAAAGGNIKKAAMSAAGGLAAGAITSKFGGGVASSAAGAVIGSKLSGGSTKSALIGGLTAGAGAFAAQKIFSAPSNPVAGATSVAKSQANIPSSINLVSAASSNSVSQPVAGPAPIESPPPPPSSTATIDKDTGKVTISNTEPSNLTTITETVIGGGSKTTYADRKDPETGKYVPVPDKIDPPTKTVTTTVINKQTGDVVSSKTETKAITKEQANSEIAKSKVTATREVVRGKPAPIILPRPINPIYEVKLDIDGNETLQTKLDAETIIPNGLELVSIVGTKDTLTLKYVDGSTTVGYTIKAAKEKFGYGKDEGTSVDTRPDGSTSIYPSDVNDDPTYPSDGQRPYFVKNSDGSITYTFSDGTTATELPSGNKSLFTINGVSAEVELPTKAEPVSLEMPADELEKEKIEKKKTWLKFRYFGYVNDEKGSYVKKDNKFAKDANGNLLYRDEENGEIVAKQNRKPGRKYRNVIEPGQTDTIPASKIDEEFEKEWNNQIKASVKKDYADIIAEKYRRLGGDDQIKTAESIDKNHIIEVKRSGYSLDGDSYKVMSVRLYKKIEEVSQ